MSDLVRNIFRFIILVFLQVYIFDAMPRLHELITPYIYFAFILWLPFTVNRFWLLILGFVLGLSVDYFSMTPGLHAAACVLIAYLRPFVINILAPKDVNEITFREPSARALGWSQYVIYVLVLTFFHNGFLLFLEWLSFGSFIVFLMKIITTSAISLLMILIAELLFPRQLKYRANTA